MTNRSNQILVPEARAGLDRLKMESAAEVGVNLKNGYNGDLTEREASSVGENMAKKIVESGSVGGNMVKKMVEAYEQGLK
ncbi:small acid-soluble spore protein [Clostridium polyendosporum]|uniref:Small acid-soluble spore protein n=1 Tax=Clostridium polyendosporum TaxID=69208 RepID=A0A919S320_9CLOT|nr:alpha/beta-type small acid-soluble spore protein [Clostridium polyendosporum]GIM30340.1 small acid-soluble spore protein [Clostridium polyendosporum]